MVLNLSSKHERGASAIEFALVLPFLLIVLFSIFECGWMVTTQLVLNHAVSQGARCAVIASDGDEMTAVVVAEAAANSAYWIGDLDSSSISASVLPSDGVLPRRVEVVVAEHPYNPLSGFLPASTLPEHMSAKSVMPFP